MEHIERFLVKGWLIAVILSSLSLPILSHTQEDYFIFLKDNKKGLRNAKDQVIIPAVYEDLGWTIGEFRPIDNVVGYKENGLWGLMSLKNNKVTESQFQNLYPLNRNLIVASKDILGQELYGIVDLEGNILLEFEYHRLNLFNNLIVAAKEVNSQIRYGILNQSYLEVVPFQYTRIKTLNNKFAFLIKDTYQGLVDAAGKILIEPKYHEIEVKGDAFKGRFFNTYEIRDQHNQLLASHQVQSLRKAGEGIVVAATAGQSQVLTTRGKVIKSLPETSVQDFVGDLAVIKQGGQFGVINSEGELLIPTNKRSIWLNERYIGVQSVDGFWSLLDINLNKISSRNYRQIKPSIEGLFAVKRLDRWGFMDGTGEEVIPPQYDEAESFNEGAAYAKYLGSWGVINQNGDWIVKPRYEKLEKLDQNTYLFQNGEESGLVSTSQEQVYRTTNTLLATPTGAIEQNHSQLLGLVSTSGERVLSTKYHRIIPFAADPNYYLFEDEESLGLFNMTSRSFFRDTAIQEIRTLDEGFIGVRINDQYGLIDLDGKLRIANRYEDVGIFSEDMVPVKIRGKWGYVNRIERLKVQPLYQTAGHFINGVAMVSKNNKYGLLNKQGKIILGLEYDRIERLPEGLFICHQGAVAGLVDPAGKVLAYPRYHSFQILDNGNFIVSKNGKLGLIDGSGRTLIPNLYDEIEYDHHNNLYLLTKKSAWEPIEL